MIIRRKADVKHDEELIRQARIKVAKTNDKSEYERVAYKFIDATYAVRKAMQAMGATSFDNYEHFYGSFDQCDTLLQDPLYRKSQDAQYAYSLLQGADNWVKHEAGKLGPDYESPEHWYKIWDLVGIDLRNVVSAK